MKDRDQKAKALKYSVSKGWLPQLEVDVHPHQMLGQRVTLITDLDVFSSMPDDFNGFRTVVIDCKTRAKESPVNRALWLKGVIDRMKSSQGFCILKKGVIEVDHRLFASQLGVCLIEENEFDLFANATSENFKEKLGHTSNIETWEKYFSLGERFPNLDPAIKFLRSKYWMIEDSAEACRKVLANIKAVKAEIDPGKREHIGFFLDNAALFARSLSILCSFVFRAHLLPKQQGDLEEALKLLLYGGKDTYDHTNSLYKLLRKERAGEENPPDLTLPEWDKFIKLVRQLLDSPISISKASIILREVGFAHFAMSEDSIYAKKLCAESPQSARFSVLIATYLCNAVKLPPELRDMVEAELMLLITTK